MASFGGATIFGLAASWATTNRPRATQLNSFFGVNGLTIIDGGSRGKTTVVTGVLQGTDISSLASAESTFRGFEDSVPRVLVDGAGHSWQNVILESFQPIGRVGRTSDGFCYRQYRAQFLHLD